jgi:hypothetical protein
MMAGILVKKEELSVPYEKMPMDTSKARHYHHSSCLILLHEGSITIMSSMIIMNYVAIM